MDTLTKRLLRAIDLADPNMEHDVGYLIKRGEVKQALITANFPHDDKFVRQVARIINTRSTNPFENL